MAKKNQKTNAVRFLERMGVPYELRHYDVDENDLGGMTVAAKVGMPAGQVFKTLVAEGSVTGPVVACIQTDGELDLKALARISGNKKVELIPVRDLRKLTGYVRGGVSPVGMKRDFPIYLDERALVWPVISLSAGVRGTQMLIAPGDLGRAVTVTTCDILKKD